MAKTHFWVSALWRVDFVWWWPWVWCGFFLWWLLWILCDGGWLLRGIVWNFVVVGFNGESYKSQPKSTHNRSYKISKPIYGASESSRLAMVALLWSVVSSFCHGGDGERNAWEGKKKKREQRTENESVREITENGKYIYIYILIEGLIGLFTNDFFLFYTFYYFP